MFVRKIVDKYILHIFIGFIIYRLSIKWASFDTAITFINIIKYSKI